MIELKCAERESERATDNETKRLLIYDLVIHIFKSLNRSIFFFHYYTLLIAGKISKTSTQTELSVTE